MATSHYCNKINIASKLKFVVQATCRLFKNNSGTFTENKNGENLQTFMFCPFCTHSAEIKLLVFGSEKASCGNRSSKFPFICCSLYRSLRWVQVVFRQRNTTSLVLRIQAIVLYLTAPYLGLATVQECRQSNHISCKHFLISMTSKQIPCLLPVRDLKSF